MYFYKHSHPIFIVFDGQRPSKRVFDQRGSENRHQAKEDDYPGCKSRYGLKEDLIKETGKNLEEENQWEAINSVSCINSPYLYIK